MPVENICLLFCSRKTGIDGDILKIKHARISNYKDFVKRCIIWFSDFFTLNRWKEKIESKYPIFRGKGGGFILSKRLT